MLARKILIEAVTISIDYADFLCETLPYNLNQVDLITVVTVPEDKATQAVCTKFGVRCLTTTCFHRDTQKPSFNKGAGINHGLMHHSQSGWMMHLDADVVLPLQFRKMAENAELDESCLYGMDRVNCESADSWDAYKANFHHDPQFKWWYLVSPPKGFTIGSRIAHCDYGGYCPPGFMQLWHPGTSRINRYPAKNNSDMEHTDILHALQWERRKRVLLPEGFLIHLDSSNNKFGANWKGRKSPNWRSPPVVPPHPSPQPPVSPPPVVPPHPSPQPPVPPYCAS